MTFDDLPPDWSDRSLTSDLLPDVVDLFVTIEERSRGCLGLLVLDRDHRMLQPIMITEMAGVAPSEEAREFFESFAQMLDETGARVVVALGRPGGGAPGAGDAAWASYLRVLLGDRIVACYLATCDAVTVIDPSAAAA